MIDGARDVCRIAQLLPQLYPVLIMKICFMIHY